VHSEKHTLFSVLLNYSLAYVVGRVIFFNIKKGLDIANFFSSRKKNKLCEN